MCDPVTVSLMAASAGATYAGNRRAQKKMDQAVGAERLRQKRFADDSKSSFDLSVANRNFKTTADSMEKTKAMLEAEYTDSMAKGKESFGVDSKPLTGDAGSGENTNVTDAYSRESARADAEAGRSATRSAKLNAFNQVMQQQALTNTRYAQDQAVLANLSRGSMGVLPFELQAASKAGDNLKLMGQVLSLASMYTGTMSAMGKPVGPSWGELFGTAPEVAATTNPSQVISASSPYNQAASGMAPNTIGPAKPTNFLTGYQAQAGNYVGGLPSNPTQTPWMLRYPRIPVTPIR